MLPIEMGMSLSRIACNKGCYLLAQQFEIENLYWANQKYYLTVPIIDKDCDIILLPINCVVLPFCTSVSFSIRSIDNQIRASLQVH